MGQLKVSRFYQIRQVTRIHLPLLQEILIPSIQIMHTDQQILDQQDVLLRSGAEEPDRNRSGTGPTHQSMGNIHPCHSGVGWFLRKVRKGALNNQHPNGILGQSIELGLEEVSLGSETTPEFGGFLTLHSDDVFHVDDRVVSCVQSHTLARVVECEGFLFSGVNAYDH